MILAALAAATMSLTACSGGADEPSAAAGGPSAGAATPTSEAASAPAGGDAGAGVNLPAQTVGQAPDCSPWTLDALGTLWGTTFTDSDEGQVTELTAAGGVSYSCDANETDSGLGLTVVVDVSQYPSEADAVASMQNTRSGATFGDTVYFALEEVPGVGDEAFYSTDPDDAGNANPVQIQMYARDGSTVFLLTALNLDGLADAQAARANLVATLEATLG